MVSDINPKKSLGQHWLHDESVLDAICDAAGVSASDHVLEIGPGLGTLTERILAKNAVVTAVEFDHDLAVALKKRVHGATDANLSVVESDILSFDLTSLPANYKVVANIPYYLTSNLLRVLCESQNPFSTAALLMQKEVAERAVAGPGSMSVLSISIQYYSEASLGVFVPARLFTPPPKVDSQVLVLKYRTSPLFPDVDTKMFFRLVKAGFSQKRKTLLNSLSAGLHLPKTDIKIILESAGIRLQARPQELGLDDWYRLYISHQS